MSAGEEETKGELIRKHNYPHKSVRYPIDLSGSRLIGEEPIFLYSEVNATIIDVPGNYSTIQDSIEAVNYRHIMSKV